MKGVACQAQAQFPVFRSGISLSKGDPNRPAGGLEHGDGYVRGDQGSIGRGDLSGKMTLVGEE